MTKVFGTYVSDDNNVVCALYMDPDTFSAMGFVTPLIGTPRRPQRMVPRKEVFQNSAGHVLRLPYPTAVTVPYAPGASATLRGDSTYVAVGTLGQRGVGESL